MYIEYIKNSNETRVLMLKESFCVTNVNIMRKDVREKAITIQFMILS
jgi:hypothetical protein